MAVGPLHLKLQECARQFLVFPRRGRLARAQADDGVADLHRLPGLQRQVADNAVALVEKADDGDAVGHWRDSDLLSRRQGRGLGVALPTCRLLLILAVTAAKKHHRQRGAGHEAAHDYSGFQAS